MSINCLVSVHRSPRWPSSAALGNLCQIREKWLPFPAPGIGNDNVQKEFWEVDHLLSTSRHIIASDRPLVPRIYWFRADNRWWVWSRFIASVLASLWRAAAGAIVRGMHTKRKKPPIPAFQSLWSFLSRRLLLHGGASQPNSVNQFSLIALALNLPLQCTSYSNSRGQIWDLVISNSNWFGNISIFLSYFTHFPSSLTVLFNIPGTVKWNFCKTKSITTRHKTFAFKSNHILCYFLCNYYIPFWMAVVATQYVGTNSLKALLFA